MSVFDQATRGQHNLDYFFVVAVLMSTGVTIADREKGEFCTAIKTAGIYYILVG